MYIIWDIKNSTDIKQKMIIKNNGQYRNNLSK